MQLLLEQNAIKPLDAIHVASGVAHGITDFVTFDDDFKSMPGITYRDHVMFFNRAIPATIIRQWQAS